MTHRAIPITREELRRALRAHEVFMLTRWLNAETGAIVEVARDLIDYCRGNPEGTDLQLSDSHGLPSAQAIAEQESWLEQGFDDEGLPYGLTDRNLFPVPSMGDVPDAELDEELDRWLDEHGLTCEP